LPPFQTGTAAPANCPPITLRDPENCLYPLRGKKEGEKKKKKKRKEETKGRGVRRGDEEAIHALRACARDVIAGGLFAGE